MIYDSMSESSTENLPNRICYRVNDFKIRTSVRSSGLRRPLNACSPNCVWRYGDGKVTRDRRLSEQRARRSHLRNWKSSPSNQISAYPRELLQQVRITERDNDWFPPPLNQSLHEVGKRLRSAGGDRVPVLPHVRSDDRNVRRVGGGNEPRKIQWRVFGRHEFGAQIW